ncbi:hypothetical protein HNO92_003712 [Chromobacterium alkanivorans]|nr:hypothetical protein [Chromobacterium alkanivorans]MCS3806377.1 hypothetical protein [Chromobacterium alkanivorans]MCS3820611.1 hypothetical protein [Chromobacterium alkanivorans]MCS3875369.1 hypothetical protein [Chromobacterium alkanivorans]
MAAAGRLFGFGSCSRFATHWRHGVEMRMNREFIAFFRRKAWLRLGLGDVEQALWRER